MLVPHRKHLQTSTACYGDSFTLLYFTRANGRLQVCIGQQESILASSALSTSGYVTNGRVQTPGNLLYVDALSPTEYRIGCCDVLRVRIWPNIGPLGRLSRKGRSQDRGRKSIPSVIFRERTLFLPF
jgi:hypothetical protein